MGRPQPIKKHCVYHVPSHAQNKLPENIIIDLHEMLLTKGIHRINVANQLYGRTLINNLLTSLNYYQNIGFLSLDNTNETGELHDVYTLLNECGYLDKDGNHDFDQFLLEALFFDIMIIEQSEQLKTSEWFDEFMRSIICTSFDSQLPIIVTSYS